MSWGSEARRHREEAGWSRPQLAVMAGISVTALYNFERDKLVGGISLYIAVALADVLGLSLDEYIGRTPPEPTKLKLTKGEEVYEYPWK